MSRRELRPLEVKRVRHIDGALGVWRVCWFPRPGKWKHVSEHDSWQEAMRSAETFARSL